MPATSFGHLGREGTLSAMASHPTPRTLEQMVEEQVRRWRLAQNKRHESEPPPRPAPVITLSREFGSLGAAVGRAAAEELGFELWDQEIVHAIAERAKTTDRMVESLDEHDRGDVEDLVTASLSGDQYTEFNYLRQLHWVIHTIHQHGSAVIIGRGAQFIIDPSECLRVRVICPRADRAADYARREGLSLEQAGAKVDEVERDRRAFIRRTFEKDVTDENHYDAIVNRAYLSVEAAGRIVVAAYHAKFGEAIVRAQPAL